MSRRRQVEKIAKKNWLTIMIVVIVAAIFFVGGFFTFKLLAKKDEFSIIGESTITLQLNGEYQDEGAKCIALGKDISSQIKVENNIDNTKVGKYYIKYSVDHPLYKNVFRYRYVNIVEVMP